MLKLTIFVSICLFVVALGAPQAGRIVGGKDAEDGQFPYQISLRRDGSHSCGGSIINSRWILTAAHCVEEMQVSLQSFTVVAGTNQLSKGGVTYDVEKVIKHATRGIDIAVIKLAKNIEFTDKIQPVELLAEYVPGGKELTLSGWGATKFPGNAPDKLQFVDLMSIGLKECRDRFANIDKVRDTEICSFTKKGEGACFGDSGGPLVLSTGEQVGIVSWGFPCAQGRPDVYVRISSFYDWIQEQIES